MFQSERKLTKNVLMMKTSAILVPVKEFLKHLEKRDLLSQIFV
jgi:hypothetical protein